MLRTKSYLVACLLMVLLPAAALQGQVPRPTLTLVGNYYYDVNTGSLSFTTLGAPLTVTQAEYLDGSVSTTDPVVGATVNISGLVFQGMDEVTGDALFTDGSLVISKSGTVFVSAGLTNVTLEPGFNYGGTGVGSFGNLNVGFEQTNLTDLVMNTEAGSQFVDEFAALIAPEGVPDQAAVQLELILNVPFGSYPTTFEENFQVSSLGTVLGVLDGAPQCTTPPEIISLTADPLIVLVDSEVSFTAMFTDPDVGDTHTATWDFGDGTDPVIDDTVSVGNPATIGHPYGAAGYYTVTLTITDSCGNTATATIDIGVLNAAACFGLNRVKIGTQAPRCLGIAMLEVTSMNGDIPLVGLYVPQEGQTKLASQTIVDDGINGPVTIQTSGSQELDVGDVFGAYTVTDLAKIMDELIGFRSNKIRLRGVFCGPELIDFALDDVTYTISDGHGYELEIVIPAGSFEQLGKKQRGKFQYQSPNGSELDIRAHFDLHPGEFRLDVMGVPDTNEIEGATLTFGLKVGNTIGEETLNMTDNKNHLAYTRHPKLTCQPWCSGISFLQVTSSEGVFEFAPASGSSKLDDWTEIHDGVNLPVWIDTSGWQPLDVGDVFGDYTVSDLVKICE